MKIAKFDPQKVNILKINILEFQANNDINNPVKKENINGFDIDIKMGIGLNIKEKIFAVQFTIKLSAISKNEKPLKVSGLITTETVFEVKNIEDFLHKEKRETKIHPILGIALAGTAYSTIRGILYTKFQETILDGVVLPLIDPVELVKAAPFSAKIKKIAS